MNKKQFIAELTSDLQKYDEAGLINYRSLNLWLQTSIKRFGNNVMVPTDKVLKVENGRVELPENFWKLDLAIKCDPEGVKVVSGDVKSVITNDTYKTRLQENYVWDNQSNTHIKKDYTQITEVVYMDNNIVNYTYNNPVILKLTKGMKKESCSKTCRNLQSKFTHSSPWEINILNNFMQTNFTKGFVYIQYEGLPTDENGDLLIPESPNGHLQEYLMYHCKAKLIENLMGNGDDTNLINMYKIYTSKEERYFSLAMTEVKFMGLSHDWDVKMKNKMRRDTMKFENLFPNR